ncbi:MAG: hypothetical protein AB8F94_29470, partial [Saprospiraceae bacterium]
YNPGTISQTTEYRRGSRRSPCTIWIYSNIVTKEVVVNYSSGGTIGSDEINCGNYNPANITSISSPSGGVDGSLTYSWERRTYNCTSESFDSWSVISGATSATYNPGSISSTTQYRRLVRNFPCTNWIESNIITKEVVENYSNAGSINGDQENCTAFDPNVIANSTLPNGSCWGVIEYRWQQREGNHCNNTWGVWTNISSANASSYDPGIVSVSTQYRRQVRQLPCTSWQTSNSISILIHDASPCAPIAQSATLTVCDNSNGVGEGVFYLQDANPDVILTATDVTVSYHATLADAQSGSNPLISPYVSQSKTIYVRVIKNSTGCVLTNNINLIVDGICAENCNNGIDDDGDGLIDCDDPDCDCCKAKAPTLNSLSKE